MGSCFDVLSKEMLLVMEYHSKGSLHDVLRNDRVRRGREKREGEREREEREANSLFFRSL
jgi:hypothetical protein